MEAVKQLLQLEFIELELGQDEMVETLDKMKARNEGVYAGIQSREEKVRLF